MANPYQERQTAEKYLNFLNSPNGRLQQKFLLQAILPVIPSRLDLKILDAGCGPGWLTQELKKVASEVEACDSSEFLINFAKKQYPDINFQTATLDTDLPYPKNHFDLVILNMVGPDLEDLTRSFNNLAMILKPGAKLIMTIPNPELTFPKAEWKRSLLGSIMGRKPSLKLRDYDTTQKQIQREFVPGEKIASSYYTLADYKNGAQSAGLEFAKLLEIRSKTDSKNFDLTYQLFRYPLLLLLEFKKPAQ